MNVPQETAFVETSVFRVINAALTRSERSTWNALVIGAPGVGKSRAIAEIVARAATVDLIPAIATMEVTPGLGSATFELLNEVADIAGVMRGKSLAQIERRLMQEGWYRVRVIIFDEAQNLSLKAARTLLAISEATGRRMIFVGNPHVLQLVNSVQAGIQQISRRLPIRETIDAIDNTDADLIASTFGCEGMDTFRAVREIAQSSHADGIVKVLQEARIFAELAGSSTINARHVANALDIFPQFRSAAPRRRPVKS